MTATRFLADNSAVIRILRKQVPESWDELIERGQISICQAVEIEVLRAAKSQVTTPNPIFERHKVLETPQLLAEWLLVEHDGRLGLGQDARASSGQSRPFHGRRRLDLEEVAEELVVDVGCCG